MVERKNYEDLKNLQTRSASEPPSAEMPVKPARRPVKAPTKLPYSIAGRPLQNEEQIEAGKKRKLAKGNEKPHDIYWEANYRLNLLAIKEGEEAKRRQREDYEKKAREREAANSSAAGDARKADRTSEKPRSGPEPEMTDARAAKANRGLTLDQILKRADSERSNGNSQGRGGRS